MKIVKGLHHVIIGIALIFLICLCVLGATGHMHVNFDLMCEALTLHHSNALFTLVKIALFAVVNLLIISFLAHLRHGLLISIVISVTVATILGIIWQSGYIFDAVADQKAVWDTAKIIAQQTDKSSWNMDYIIMFPQQKGLVCVFELLIHLFGETGGLRAYRILCLISCVAVIAFGSLLAYSLSGRTEAGIAASVLLLECVPLEIYTVFLYGTMPSLGFMVIAFFCACQLAKSRKPWILIPLAVSSAAMILFYTSTLIAMIAIAITLFLSALARRLEVGFWNKDVIVLLCGAILPVLMAFCVNFSAGVLFERATGVSPNEDSMPASCWIVMGISSDGDLGPGGFDSSSTALFDENNRDEEQTDRVAKEQIKVILSDYANGSRDLSFFVEKTRVQWTDPWFNSLTMTIYSSKPDDLGNLSFFFEHNIMQYTEDFLTILMCAGYLFAAIEMIVLLRNRKFSVETMLLPIYFVGGFVFQLFWESKGRYCFPYYICLLILAGIGMTELLSAWKKRKIRRSDKLAY